MQRELTGPEARAALERAFKDAMTKHTNTVSPGVTTVLKSVIHQAGKKTLEGYQFCNRCGLVMAEEGLMPWPEGESIELTVGDRGGRIWIVSQGSAPNCGAF